MGGRGPSEVDSTEEESEQDSATDQHVAFNGRHQSFGSQDYRPAGPVAPRELRDTGCKVKKSILRFRGLGRETSGASEIFSSSAVCCLARGRQSAEDPFSYDPPWRFRWQCTEAWKLRDLSKRESPTSGLFETWGRLGKAEIRLCAARSEPEPDVSNGVLDKKKTGQVSLLGGTGRRSVSLSPPERTQLKGRQSSEGRRNNGRKVKTACTTPQGVPFGVFLVFRAAVRAEFTIRVVQPYSEGSQRERVREACSRSVSQSSQLKKEAETTGADGCPTQRQERKSTSSKRVIKGQRRTANEESEPEKQRAGRKNRTTKEEEEKVLKESKRLQCEYSGRRDHWQGIASFAALDATAGKETDVLFIDILIHRAVPLNHTSEKVASGAACESPQIRARQGTNMTISTAASTTSLATSCSRSSRRFTGRARSVEHRLQMCNTMEHLREEAPEDICNSELRESVVETFSKPPRGRTRSEQIVKQRTRAIQEGAASDIQITPPARSPTMGEPPIRLFRQSVKSATNPENAYPSGRDGRLAERDGEKQASRTCPTPKGRRRRDRASKKKSEVGPEGGGTRPDARSRDPNHPRRTAEHNSSAATQVSAGADQAASPKAGQSRPAVVGRRQAAENAALQSGQLFPQNAGEKDSPGPAARGSQRARGRKSRRNVAAKRRDAAECAEGRRKSAISEGEGRGASARGPPLVSRRKQTNAVKKRTEAFTKTGQRESIVRKSAANDSRQLGAERGGASRGLLVDSSCTQGGDRQALGFDAVEGAALLGLIRSVLSAVAPACAPPSAPSTESFAFCEGGAPRASRSTLPEFRPVPECDALAGRSRSDFRSFPQSSASSCSPFNSGPSLGTGVTTVPGDAVRACRIALECLLKYQEAAGEDAPTGQASLHPISTAENREGLHVAAGQSSGRPVPFASAPGSSRLPHSASIANDRPVPAGPVIRGAGERGFQSGGAHLGASDCACRPGFVAEYPAHPRRHSELSDTFGPAAATHILGTVATHPAYSVSNVRARATGAGSDLRSWFAPGRPVFFTAVRCCHLLGAAGAWRWHAHVPEQNCTDQDY